MLTPSRRFTLGAAALLVAAPLIELVETLLSPLTDGSTADDLRAIAAHQSVFVLSVLVGLLATILYVPAFLALARLTWNRSPRLSAVGGAVAVLSMLGFMGVRMVQAVELQAVREPLGIQKSAALVDSAATNPIGAVFLLLFLGGSVIGVGCLAIATWRAHVAPRPAVVLFLAFPFVDLLMPGRLGTVVAHAVLLAGLGWIGLAAARGWVASPAGEAGAFAGATPPGEHAAPSSR
jgi:hypothetical protein